MSKIAFFTATIALALVLNVALAEKSFAQPGHVCPSGEYIPAGGNLYPHIHCGSNFLTLSKTAASHINILPNNTATCNARRQSARDYITDQGAAINAARSAAIMGYLNGNNLWCN